MALIDIIADPQVVAAAVAAVVAVIGAAAAAVVAGLRYIGRRFDARLAHISATASEARDAAQSADSGIWNTHSTNIRDDLDRAIMTVRAVSDQIGEIVAQVQGLRDQGETMVQKLEVQGESLTDMQARVGRISERVVKIDDELHDERTAREAYQRVIDEHAHDAHIRLHDRVDKLQEKMNKWDQS